MAAAVRAAIDQMTQRADVAVRRHAHACDAALNALQTHAINVRNQARTRAAHLIKALDMTAECALVNALQLRVGLDASLQHADVSVKHATCIMPLMFDVDECIGTLYTNAVDVKQTTKRIYEPPMLYAIGETAPAYNNNTFIVHAVDKRCSDLHWLQADDIEIRCESAIQTHVVTASSHQSQFNVTIFVLDIHFADDLHLQLHISGVCVYQWTARRCFDFCAEEDVNTDLFGKLILPVREANSFDINETSEYMVTTSDHDVVLNAVHTDNIWWCSHMTRIVMPNVIHASFGKNSLMIGVRDLGVHEFALVADVDSPVPVHTYECADIRCFDVRSSVLVIGKNDGTIVVYDCATREKRAHVDPRVRVFIHALRVMPNLTHVLFVPGYVTSGLPEAMVVRLDGAEYCNVLTLLPYGKAGAHQGLYKTEIQSIAVSDAYQMLTVRKSSSAYAHRADPTRDGLPFFQFPAPKWVVWRAGKTWILGHQTVRIYK